MKMKADHAQELRATILQEIYKSIDDYLYSRFSKVFTNYVTFLYDDKELQGKSIFHVIALKESVDVMTVYDDIKNRVYDVFKHHNIPPFIFFGDTYTEEAVKKEGFTQVLKQTMLPPPNSAYIQFLQEHPEVALLILPPVGVTTQSNNAEEEFVSRRKFEEIILTGIQRKASDIHIVLKPTEYHVFYRIDGLAIHEPKFTMSKKEGAELLRYMLNLAAKETKGAQFNPEVRLRHQDGKITFNHPSLQQPIGLRAAFTPDGVSMEHMKTTIRILKTQDINLTEVAIRSALIEKGYISKDDTTIQERIKQEPLVYALISMGYLEEDARLINSFLTAKRGLIVISGITNSGKSTFVNTILNFINNRLVATVEDPIEYVVRKANVSQYQLFQGSEDMQMDFLDYIKAFKRGDLDVVFVGEWRRHEGLTDAILEQAMAGQLIYTTLHIATSFHIYEALRSMYKVRLEDLRSILYLSWNQALVPKLCPHCKIEKKDYHPSKDEQFVHALQHSLLLTDRMKQRLLGFNPDRTLNTSIKTYYFRNPKGCPHCNYTGYKGRQPVYDYFVPTVDMYDTLGERLSPIDIIRTKWNNERKKTKVDTYLEFVRQGVISIVDIVGNDVVDRII